MSNKMRNGRTSRSSRRVRHAWSYGPLLRLADNLHGGQDAKTATDDGLVLMPWFVRMTSTRLENDQRLFAGVQDRLRGSVSALKEVFGQVTELDAHVRDLTSRVAQIVPANLTTAGGAEQHLSQEAVAVRRAREHRATVAASQSQVNAARARQQSLVGTALTLRAQIVEEFELAQAVSERMRHYYSRRICSYARRLGRDGSTSGDLDFHLDPAPWTTAPCPWLPLGLDDRLSGPIVIAEHPVDTDEKEI